MAQTPTFAIGPTFMGVTTPAAEADYVIAGAPFDIGVTNRAGSRFGPQAVRQASRMLCDGANPSNWTDIAELKLADIGNFAIAMGDIQASLKLIEDQAAQQDHLITIGGDHTITLPLLRALAKKQGGPVGLIHFDAHVDTWPDNFGAVYAHGSVFWHAIEEGLVDPQRMIQIGIRSPVQKEVWDWTTGKGVRIIPAEEVHERGISDIVSEIKDKVGGGKTYLSFDIDAIDPAQAPGTGTPEVGGLFTWQVQAILKRLGGIDFVGMDIVEVCPPYDLSEITALAAASVVWQYLGLRP